MRGQNASLLGRRYSWSRELPAESFLFSSHVLLQTGIVAMQEALRTVENSFCLVGVEGYLARIHRHIDRSFQYCVSHAFRKMFYQLVIYSEAPSLC